jgi:hypothetical protein
VIRSRKGEMKIIFFFAGMRKLGVYILENTPLPDGGKYQVMKNMKREREKGDKCKRKRKKGVCLMEG